MNQGLNQTLAWSMSAGFRITPALWDKIHHFASFPQTGVSLQQMVLFGQNPSQGTLLKASQFLAGSLLSVMVLNAY